MLTRRRLLTGVLVAGSAVVVGGPPPFVSASRPLLQALLSSIIGFVLIYRGLWEVQFDDWSGWSLLVPGLALSGYASFCVASFLVQ